MRVLVAPDSFKGTYDAPIVAAAVCDGLGYGGLIAVPLPVADRGEGTLDALEGPLGRTRVLLQASNAWGRRLEAEAGLSADGVAVTELARTCGLHAPHEGSRDPLLASTYGLGEHIAAALDLGARHVVVAAGGSATSDGGAGAVQALQEHGGIATARLMVLADVTTRYIDAAAVFGPQKGATPEDVEWLATRLQRLRGTLRRDPQQVSGSGATGGLAGGLWAQYDAEIVSGARFVLDAVGFDEAVAGAEAVVVGEGQLDAQSTQGKIIAGILARSGGVPVHAAVGSVSPGNIPEGFASVRVASDLDQLRAAGADLAVELGSGQ